MNNNMTYRIVFYLSMIIFYVVVLVSLKDIKSMSFKKRRKKLENMSKIIKRNRRKEILNSKDKLIDRVQKKINNVIELSGYDITISRFFMLILIAILPGVVLGFVLNNPMLVIVLGLMTGSIPFFYFKYVFKKNVHEIESALPMALGNIIAQYMSEEDFVVAVEKKLDQLPSPIDKFFSSFVVQVQMLNIDVVTALRTLKGKIDNYYFKEFIELAIQTEIQGEKLKYTMLCIPEDMRYLQQVQEEFNLTRKKYNRDFIACLVFLPLNLMILKVGYERYYYLLVNTTIGKIGLFLIVIIMFMCTILMLHYNKQIKVEID